MNWWRRLKAWALTPVEMYPDLNRGPYISPSMPDGSEARPFRSLSEALENPAKRTVIYVKAAPDIE